MQSGRITGQRAEEKSRDDAMNVNIADAVDAAVARRLIRSRDFRGLYCASLTPDPRQGLLLRLVTASTALALAEMPLLLVQLRPQCSMPRSMTCSAALPQCWI